MIKSLKLFAKNALTNEIFISIVNKIALNSYIKNLKNIDDIYCLSWTTLEASKIISKRANANLSFAPLFPNPHYGYDISDSKKIKQIIIFLVSILKKTTAIYFLKSIKSNLTEESIQYLGLKNSNYKFINTIGDIIDNKIESKKNKAIVITDRGFNIGSQPYRIIEKLSGFYEEIQVIVLNNNFEEINKASQKFSFGKKVNIVAIPTRIKRYKLFEFISSLVFRWFQIKLNKKIKINRKKILATNIVKKVADVKAHHNIIDSINVFAKNASKIASYLNPNFVHSVDLISVVTGAEISKGRIPHVLDINEFPIFEERIGNQFKSLSKENIINLYSLTEKSLSGLTGAIAYSQGVARISSIKYKIPVSAVRNFHNLVKIKNNKKIREDWNIDDNSFVVCHVCTIAESYKTEIAIQAISVLPSNYHLVFVGSAYPSSYQEALEKLVKKLNVANRVHFKGDINNFQEYIDYISGADVGIITLFANVANVRFGLSNRFVDLLAAELPIVSSYSIETKIIINKYNIGEVVMNCNPESFAQAILRVTNLSNDDKNLLKQRVKNAAKLYSWNQEIKNYQKFIPMVNQNPSPLAIIVFQRGLVKNRRTLRFANQLQEMGYKTLLFCTTIPSESVLSLSPNTKFAKIPTHKIVSDIEAKTMAEKLEIKLNTK